AGVVNDYIAKQSSSPVTGREAFDAVQQSELWEDAVIMATNVRFMAVIKGLLLAAEETNSIVNLQQAMSELVYTWPEGKDDIAENSRAFAKIVRDTAGKLGINNYLLKGDHITVKVDAKFLADTEAHDKTAAIFEDILAEEDISVRETKFLAVLNNEDIMADANVANALNAVGKAFNLVKAEVEEGYAVFALDASFMPTRLNVLTTAFLDGFIPETASHEAEVGEIGGSTNSTVADVLEFIEGTSEWKGLLDYGVKLDRLAINNGTSHGNNYDADGNLIVTKMNLKATAEITEALIPYGITIVQHGITGTPLENLPALRSAGITEGHVGTQWQNIVWELLNEEAKTNISVAALVDEMIDDLVARFGSKYNVTDRATADEKDMQKLIGKELKNITGLYQDKVAALGQGIEDKITEAIRESAVDHFKAFKSVGTAGVVNDYIAKQSSSPVKAANEIRDSLLMKIGNLMLQNKNLQESEPFKQLQKLQTRVAYFEGKVSLYGDFAGELREIKRAFSRIAKEAAKTLSEEFNAPKSDSNDALIKEISSSPVGGINLNPNLLDLQIKRDGNGVPLPINMQPIHQMRIDGFVPVIINVTPVVNLPLLLGLANSESPIDSANADSQTETFNLSLADKYRNKYILGYERQDDNVDA
ncbi:class II fructose-bisphosphate aldolase, partial [Candidatus Pacearchaeota archaeon]|nr:class II fructose-bisphosphate aldolase [Candidatus Pacearchaeota archaeon]